MKLRPVVQQRVMAYRTRKLCTPCIRYSTERLFCRGVRFHTSVGLSAPTPYLDACVTWVFHESR